MFWRIVEGPDVIDNGQLYWACEFWADRASFDRGERPVLVEDFRTDANRLVGLPRRKLRNRMNLGIGEIQLADGTWIPKTVWIAEGQLTGTFAERAFDDLPPLTEEWLERAVIAQMQRFVEKRGSRRGVKTDPSLVGGKRKTGDAPERIRNMEKEFDSSDEKVSLHG